MKTENGKNSWKTLYLDTLKFRFWGVKLLFY